ncbi:Holliday junction resolvase RuvX [Rufibacter glacialis]|uniref:Putative pre-16S rRNA nuclease n=1 Tax=Rufibacter glacialis TaxID=1259555 RepID=A0A5M8QDX7_9BACT|nr:Holliday junction resolvase RuvX [Rufibacter glacialis]KAA6433213.1 Holliday junction resolvase RuvX [Rufibacter glacialis]GGK76411.1 putative pre-16S rRNA nuclease [Rufibacter glacialis]
MGRILAIDYGVKRVGLAVTDPLQIIASGLDTVHSQDVLAFLARYFQQEPVDEIIVGMPKHLDSSDTNNTQHVVGFVRKLQKQFPDKKVITHDERFTSRMAFQTMIDMGISKKARADKATVDKISATIILQSYLESRQYL